MGACFSKQSECYLPHPLRVFEMVITPYLEYPLMCVDVTRSYSTEDILRHNLINLNTGTTWIPDEDDDMDGMATAIPRQNLNVKNVTQIEKDAILVCFGNLVRAVNPFTPKGRTGTFHKSHPFTPMDVPVRPCKKRL
ncbi:mitogen-activated protein kinase kinase kinase kinase 3-like [Palaemon carinicauda]|uniref:mitogen-activated protein kinase kinase kinase kinase 3-like n=1 Tax=Palaemon carinicauda TaxID=392227 RepID=UPI0035B5A303